MQALKVIVEAKGKSTTLRFIGSIDEEAALEKIKVGADDTVIIDVDGVNFINSFGGREWIKWTRTISGKKSLKFLNCPSIFLEYANMIQGFIPANGKVESFKVPYYCEKCNTITTRSYETGKISDITKDIATTLACSNCNEAAEIDVVFPHFFKFLRS